MFVLDTTKKQNQKMAAILEKNERGVDKSTTSISNCFEQRRKIDGEDVTITLKSNREGKRNGHS